MSTESSTRTLPDVLADYEDPSVIFSMHDESAPNDGASPFLSGPASEPEDEVPDWARPLPDTEPSPAPRALMPSPHELLAMEMPEPGRENEIRKLLESTEPSLPGSLGELARELDSSSTRIHEQMRLEASRLAEIRRLTAVESEKLAALIESKREDAARLTELRSQVDVEMVQLTSLRERTAQETARLEQLRRECRTEEEKMSGMHGRTQHGSTELAWITAQVQAEQERAAELRERTAAELHRLQEAQDQMRQESDRLADAETRTRGEVLRLQSVQGQIEQENRRLTELQRQETELISTMRDLESRLLVQRKQLESIVAAAQEYALFAARRAAAEEEMQTKQAEFEVVSERLEQARRELSSTENRREQQSQALAVVDHALDSLRAREDQVRDLLERATAESNRLQERIEQTQQRIAAVEDRQRSVHALCETTESRTEQLSGLLAQVKADIGQELARVRTETGQEVARVRNEFASTVPVPLLEPRAFLSGLTAGVPPLDTTFAHETEEAGDIRRRKLRDLAWTPWMADREMPSQHSASVPPYTLPAPEQQEGSDGRDPRQ